MIKKIFFILLSVFIGSMYLFSAWSKLNPIEPFEFTFVDVGVSNWFLAPFIARTFIGLEFLLGVLFVLNINVAKKVSTSFIRKTETASGLTSKISIGLLSFFTIYLLIIYFKNGNESNCGCFGEMLPMTPLQSIFKNIIFIIFNLIIFKQGYNFNLKNYSRYFVGLTIIAAVSYPYIYNAVDIDYSKSYLISKENTYNKSLDTLIQYGKLSPVKAEIKNGKKVMAFLSSSCPHCKIGATKLRIISDKNPEIPMFFAINGSPESIAKFRKENKCENIPWTQLSKKPFVFYAGLKLPYIALVNGETFETELNYFTLQQNEVEKWLEKK